MGSEMCIRDSVGSEMCIRDSVRLGVHVLGRLSGTVKIVLVSVVGFVISKVD